MSDRTILLQPDLAQPSLLQPDKVLEQLPVAYAEIDAQGIVRAVNPAACQLHQMSAEEILGRFIWEFVPGDEAMQDRIDFFRAMESGEDPPIIRRSLYTAAGEYRTHEIHRRMVRDADANPAGLSCAIFDVSELEAANQESKRARTWLESALTAIPQAVILTDALGFVRYINDAAERLTGWPSREMLGVQIEKGMPILDAVSKSHKPLSFETALQEPWNGDVDLQTRERQTVSVWLSASPILDQESGITNGVVIVLGSPKIATQQAG
jgi:PAS domain S-box-containing protein